MDSFFLSRAARVAVLVLVLGTGSGCGFAPVYGDRSDNGTPVAESLGRVAIASIPDRPGQILRNLLIDRMYLQGRPENPESTLSVTLTSSVADLGILKDATTSRRELTLVATYQLRDRKGGVILRGQARSVVSSSKLEAPYGTVVAQKDAEERALHEVSEQIVNRLALHYATTTPARDSALAVRPAPVR